MAALRSVTLALGAHVLNLDVKPAEAGFHVTGRRET